MPKIYIAMHKPYPSPQDALYAPIQVGAAGKKAFCDLRDDSGEHISAKNASFCELTALYWIRHNTHDDVAGLVHYRRHFKGGHRSADWCGRVLQAEELETLLAGADIILPRKRHYWIETTRSHYAHAHHEKDLQLTREIIAQQCPEYAEAFDTVMRRRSGHRFNMLIMRRECMEAYCDWLFPILFALESRIDISDYDPYNRRVFGFIAERLMDVWLLLQPYRVAECAVLETEPPNWLKKGWHFLQRKLHGTAHHHSQHGQIRSAAKHEQNV